MKSQCAPRNDGSVALNGQWGKCGRIGCWQDRGHGMPPLRDETGRTVIASTAKQFRLRWRCSLDCSRAQNGCRHLHPTKLRFTGNPRTCLAKKGTVECRRERTHPGT